MATRTKATATSHRTSDIAGVSLLALAAVLIVALVTAKAGLLGEGLSTLLRFLFGRGAWAVPPLISVVGIGLLRGQKLRLQTLYYGLGLLFLAVLGGVARGRGGDFFDPASVTTSGGYFGAILGWLLNALLGQAAGIGIALMGIAGFVLCVDVPLRMIASSAARRTKRAAAAAKAAVPKRRSQPDPEAEAKRLAPLRKPRSLPEAETPAIANPEARKPRDLPAAVIEDERPVHVAVAVAAPPMKREKEKRKEEEKPKPVEIVHAPSLEISDEKEGYQLPPLDLLNEPAQQAPRDNAEMDRNIATLESTLDQFGIPASVVEVATGPTITRYEVQLGAGVRVNRITALADNIAMDLAASQVRVEAPIPGKQAIGVEVPNLKPTMVTLRELCEREEFRSHPSRLCFALGKDVSGIAKYADMTRMPHLLIGGATNSGKSIGLATLITSLLMRNTPKDLRFVMIDPKRVELTLFDSIPHLLCPVIKETSEAAGVLAAVWREMDRRYDMFSEKGVRNIDGWNSKATFQERLPYIVVVIDELADLMIQHRAEVETIIVRLAQLARAVGIHMVLATQRPSVDVITGLIKANIPSRLAFSTASAIDSRTILDSKGAEALIGKGDMLFSPIDAIKPVRIQGCYVSEKEIEDVCAFWRAQQATEYTLEPVSVEGAANPKGERGDFGEESNDPFWEEAVRWTVDCGKVSTSNLQRKFGIGFQRASRILDSMEEQGIVGPQNGPRPREVLVSPLDVDGMFGTAVKYDVGATLSQDELGI
ncbi:DNA translocase FtsK [bacterium]|nr:MAG: DNA translocase FtsK [bacterium]